jgi:outer membrane protein OmpA-like peptidoglycan-associated protein
MLFWTASLRLAQIPERGGGSRSGRHEIKKLLAAIAVLAVAGCSEPPAGPGMEIFESYPPASYMVFFDWDHTTLSPQSIATIKVAADWFKTKSRVHITAVGHTDRSGPENYNVALSLRRATVVRDELVRDGVPADVISIVGKGDTQPLLPTPDGERELQNRRVEILWQ